MKTFFCVESEIVEIEPGEAITRAKIYPVEAEFIPEDCMINNIYRDYFEDEKDAVEYAHGFDEFSEVCER